MRISAWSSDVCSSDLPGVEHVQAAEEDLVMGGDRLGSTGGIGRKGDCEGEGGAQQGRRGQGRRPAAGRQKTSELHRGSLRKSLRKVDRKSVGQGNGVLVRVEVGGRRTNKKKKK